MKIINAVTLAQDLIRFDTRNPEALEYDCSIYLANLLQEAGFSVEFYEFAPKRPSFVARIGGIEGLKRIGFTGHIDTVPFGFQKWSADPLAADIVDGKLYGRGSSDMKSGVAAMVSALVELAPYLMDTCGVELVITAAEETGCEGSEYLASINGALGDVGALVVAEPSYNKPLIGHKGAYWFECTLQGKAAHGSMPELGVNAINKAARVVNALEDFEFNVARHEMFGKPTINVGNISGGLNINSVPDRTTIGVDVRTLITQSHQYVAEQIESYLGSDVEIHKVADVEGVWTEPDAPWVKTVTDIVTPYLGTRPEPGIVPFFTDAGKLKPAYGNPPTIILGPGETHMAHQTDEYCFTKNIEDAAGIYKDITQNWCGV